MPNSYIAVPNVLPGNVTIGGNLTVTGNVVRIGTASPFMRIGKSTASVGEFSYNYDFIGAARDTADYAFRREFTTQLAGERQTRFNPAGTSQLEAALSTLFTDYTPHTHTGTTTEDTIYTKTLRGNLIGINGALHIRLGMNINAQGAGSTTVRVKLGGTAIATFLIPAALNALPGIVDVFIYNGNSASSQANFGAAVFGTTPLAVSRVISGINTAADQALTVTSQSANAADNQNFDTIEAALENTFGPVA